MRSDDGQTPAQRQAAAKLALRKQLEKTLLQVINLILNVESFLTIFCYFSTDSSTKTSST